MHQTLKTFFCTRRLCISLFILFALPVHVHAGTSGDIVVTIKPLYSLVAQLSEGIEKPVLLIKQMPSPHHYSMRPSDRRLLSNARMIIWIGPQMESYLDKVIQQQAYPNGHTIIVSAMQADGVRLLDRRIKNDALHTADDPAHDHEKAGHLDPHIWLSSHNAIAISKHIAQQLIISDPKNTTRYENNLQRLTDRITLLAAEIKTDLENNQQPFITYHDAFQYFEDENKLRYIDSINFDEEAGTSLKHLHQIKTEIEKNNIQCLLYQPPKPDIIDTLTTDTTLKAVALDPLGLNINDDKEAWFKIMRSIATNFKHCLDNG